ncbi:MAG: peptidylprolyl isomerase [Phycisphaeraceae bacterium]
MMRLACRGIFFVVALALLTAPAHADEAAERFAEVYGQLRAMTAEAQEIRTAYAEAEGEEQAELAERFNALVMELRAMTPQLADATIDAYAAAPNADEDVAATLAEVAGSAIARDRFDEAYRATRLMIEHEHASDERHALAGIAAFAVGEFDEAAAHFEAAEQAGAMTQRAARFAGSVADYQEYGEQEQAIRAEEAEADDLPRVRLETTAGDMVIELFEDHAPNTVANFINLVEDGFYDGLSFHRVLPNFMAQGGCPEGTGTGGPGYAVPCELDGEYRRHFRGTLSMAHAGTDTGGSQFFLTFLPTPHLNGRHTAFGRVVEGMDVLAQLERVDPQRPQPGVEPSTITKATVIRKRDHDYDLKTLPATR